jgi:hypothetical protein
MSFPLPETVLALAPKRPFLSFAVQCVVFAISAQAPAPSLWREIAKEFGMGQNVARNLEAPKAEAASIVLVPVSPGELIDKMTILAIKTERVKNVQKRLMAAQELALLQKAAARLLAPGSDLAAEIAPLMEKIKTVNLALWEIEDDLRALEQAQDFGPRFVELARSVYRTNDERARLKNAISAAAGSALAEVKEHPEY